MGRENVADRHDQAVACRAQSLRLDRQSAPRHHDEAFLLDPGDPLRLVQVVGDAFELACLGEGDVWRPHETDGQGTLRQAEQVAGPLGSTRGVVEARPDDRLRQLPAQGAGKQVPEARAVARIGEADKHVERAALQPRISIRSPSLCGQQKSQGENGKRPPDEIACHMHSQSAPLSPIRPGATDVIARRTRR